MTTETLDRAATAGDLTFAAWTPEGVVSVVSRGMAELLGEPPEAVIGCRVTDFEPVLGRCDSKPLDLLGSGAIDAIRSRREVHRAGQPSLPVWLCTRAIEVDGRVNGVALVRPVATAGSSRDRRKLWQELDDVIIGVVDRQRRAVSVSPDFTTFLGYEVADIVGTSLLDLVHPEDRRADATGRTYDDLPCRCRLRHRAGGWTQASVLWADDPHDVGRRAFAILAAPGPEDPAWPDRVAELELRLRRIGAEVQAAGVLDARLVVPDLSEVPQIAELTRRQWDIVSRLLSGQNSRQIADDLYVSQSTVRSHLTAIFRKLGVHSQVELIRRLRSQ